MRSDTWFLISGGCKRLYYIHSSNSEQVQVIILSTVLIRKYARLRKNAHPLFSLKFHLKEFLLRLYAHLKINLLSMRTNFMHVEA